MCFKDHASMFITFVEPILLYGSEVWFLTEPLTAMLDRFQAEIGKRILQLPNFHSNISVRVVSLCSFCTKN